MHGYAFLCDVFSCSPGIYLYINYICFLYRLLDEIVNLSIHYCFLTVIRLYLVEIAHLGNVSHIRSKILTGLVCQFSGQLKEGKKTIHC